MEVEILESAHNDMLEGYWFYERRQPGLGDYFTDTLYGEMGSLQLYAGIHPRRMGFLMKLSKVFPYAIYYDVEDGVAMVYAVLSTKRDSDWICAHLLMAR